MKLKSAILFLVFFCLSAGIALADMIEVKGRGFISGTIVREEGDKLVFRGNDGKIQYILKSVVTYIEKEKPHSAKSPLPTPVKNFLNRLSDAAPSSMSAQHLGQRPDKSADLADQIMWGLRQFSLSALDFLFRSEDVTTLVRTMQAEAAGFKNYESKNLVLGGVGMAIMFFGMLGVAVFGFRLIADAFQKHFLWGLAYLTIPLSYTSSFVGGALGLFAMLPVVASICFIVFYWRVARATFVAQIYSGSLILLGFFVLEMAS